MKNEYLDHISNILRKHVKGLIFFSQNGCFNNRSIIHYIFVSSAVALLVLLDYIHFIDGHVEKDEALYNPTDV